MGKVRKNNEDNLFYCGRILDSDNEGIQGIWTDEEKTSSRIFAAVFDGMGGENFGELASFSAAQSMRDLLAYNRTGSEPPEEVFGEFCRQLNLSVVAEKVKMLTSHMGTTLVAFCFDADMVWACNLGDSRAYRLRDGVLTQMSEDHVEKWGSRKKAPLTQHLGIEPEELILEPTIVSCMMENEDQYLLCSDGLTDMLTEEEIAGIMSEPLSVEACVQKLIDTALENGGRDNITVILYRVSSCSEQMSTSSILTDPVPSSDSFEAPAASAAEKAPENSVVNEPGPVSTPVRRDRRRFPIFPVAVVAILLIAAVFCISHFAKRDPEVSPNTQTPEPSPTPTFTSPPTASPTPSAFPTPTPSPTETAVPLETDKPIDTANASPEYREEPGSIPEGDNEAEQLPPSGPDTVPDESYPFDERPVDEELFAIVSLNDRTEWHHFPGYGPPEESWHYSDDHD